MSKFITVISVDTSRVTNQLPENSFIHKISFNPKTGVEIIWNNENLVTGFTFPTEYPEANLKGDLPSGVTVKDGFELKKPVDKRFKKKQIV